MPLSLGDLPSSSTPRQIETTVILRWKILWVFYDDNGNETERVVLNANGDLRMLSVVKDR